MLSANESKYLIKNALQTQHLTSKIDVIKVMFINTFTNTFTNGKIP